MTLELSWASLELLVIGSDGLSYRAIPIRRYISAFYVTHSIRDILVNSMIGYPSHHQVVSDIIGTHSHLCTVRKRWFSLEVLRRN